MTAASIFFPSPAYADLYFEQEVHVEQNDTSRISTGKSVSDFKRKIFIADELLIFQIEEGGKLKKEYGFDFAKNRYYEAEPAVGYFKLFDLALLQRAFSSVQYSAPSHGSRREIARDFSEALTEGKIDYPVHVRKAFFGLKRLGGFETHLYKLRAGPGSLILNPFGWYRSADIWASTLSPGFEEYSKTTARLGKLAGFYKLKSNQISDFVMSLSVLPAFPMRIDSVAKRRFGRASARETSREVTLFIRASKIDTKKLLYFKYRSNFSWHVVFSKGTDLGRDVLMKRGEDFNLKGTLGWLIIPGLFLVSIYGRFFSGIAQESDLSLRRLLVLRFYVLFSALFLAQIGHYIIGVAYLGPPWAESIGVFILGAGLISREVFMHLKNVKGRMREEHFKFCPNCRAPIEQFYLVCPKCNKTTDGAR